MSLKDWSTDKIIGTGLIAALLILVVGYILFALCTGNFPTTDLPMNIVTGLVGYMGRSLLEKKPGDNNSAQNL